MKTYSYLFVAFLLVTFSSCSKKDNNTVTTPPVTAFTISGQSSISMPADGSIVQPLTVSHVSGTQEQVTLLVSGLPSGATDTFTTNAGTPTFSTNMTIYGNDAATGAYHINVKGTSASGVTANYTFTLNITASNKSLLVGKWKLTASAVDDNGNGTMDDSEVISANYSSYSDVYRFNNDSMGAIIEYYDGTEIQNTPIDWVIVNGDLQISGAPYHIDKLTSTSLVLKYEQYGSTAWMLFDKTN